MNANTINSKNVISGVNDLATKYPKVSAMWSDKNDYTPSEISARSERRAIFVCPDCKKEFVTSVRAMTRAIASGATCCPDCKMRMRTISAARKDEHDYAKSVGTTITMKDGSKATCTAYHGVNNITVCIFPDFTGNNIFRTNRSILCGKNGLKEERKE